MIPVPMTEGIRIETLKEEGWKFNHAKRTIGSPDRPRAMTVEEQQALKALIIDSDWKWDPEFDILSGPKQVPITPIHHHKYQYVVVCRRCGIQPLSQGSFRMQMNRPNARWVCPCCGETAQWDDECLETNPPDFDFHPMAPGERLLMEEAIAAKIEEMQEIAIVGKLAQGIDQMDGLNEEETAQLGRDLLKLVLQKFCPFYFVPGTDQYAS